MGWSIHTFCGMWTRCAGSKRLRLLRREAEQIPLLVPERREGLRGLGEREARPTCSGWLHRLTTEEGIFRRGLPPGRLPRIAA